MIRIDSGSDVSACDGKRYWWMNPDTGFEKSTAMPEKDVKRLKDLYRFQWGFLITSREQNRPIDYTGKERINNKTFYILKFIEEGNDFNLYIDAETFLEHKIVGKLQDYNVKAETLFEKFEKTDEIVHIKKYNFIVNDQTDVVTVIDSVLINPDIDESIFKKPKTLMFRDN